MKALSVTGIRNALIVAPHPDDEAIGAFGLIRVLKKRSARVRVVVVTDGAGSHRHSALWPEARLVRQRRGETLQAMRGIGVTARDVTFLGLPDGDLSHVPREVSAALGRLRRMGDYDLIVLPAGDDDHADHRAVAAALRDRRTRTLEYLVWSHKVTRSRRATHMIRLGRFAATKRGTIRRYRSQMGLITDDPEGFAISSGELAGFAHPVERFREVRR